MVGKRGLKSSLFKKFLSLSRPGRAIYLIQAFWGFWVFKQFLGPCYAGHNCILFLTFLVGFQFMYYAVYIINDLIDYPKDKLDKALSHKPLVSGQVSRQEAVFFLLFHLVGGSLYFVLLRDWYGLSIAIGAIIYNIIYTLIFKKQWFIRYLANGFTHVLRFGLPILWCVLHQGTIVLPTYVLGFSLVLYWFLVANIINFRRIMDGAPARYVFFVLYIITYVLAYSLLQKYPRAFIFFSSLLVLDIIVVWLFSALRLLVKLRDLFIKTHL